MDIETRAGWVVAVRKLAKRIEESGGGGEGEVFTPEEKTKLEGVAENATANATDTFLLNRANHTGEQPVSTVTGLQSSLDSKVDKEEGKGMSEEDFTLSEKNKLSGVEDGATANATDSQLRDRSTHTGTQGIDTISGLQDALDDIIARLDAIEAE